ncbi:TetR/AcrR family transcriptional regulator [Actinoallomurus iriomotensis]|uniref:TetR family transcriptional regulator n=1 Tax=Actinoallomurus iriomotensis TaxID=478107 RepID=A0A9W6SDQ2_9ACTN|nr:TetR/AcrR family transcriptional regulator [Actinoallomurus iriomotensis]GLY91708.1 TetR family transcriptional regulator [Actinoallomurus iriomotensis]
MNDDAPAVRRRRGFELEAAILRATWEELGAVGYMNLTMEGVADRARTGKQVLYRRWRNRAELVLAAMRSRVVSIADDVPDTGELRGDVLAVLDRMARRYDDVGSDVVHGLMAEARDLDPVFFSIMTGVMETILRRAADRGEILSGAVGRRITTLPADLLRHEMLLTSAPVPESTLVEIVDDVFLPLVNSRAGRRR